MTEPTPTLAAKAAGPAEIATFAFKSGGAPHVVVVLKASFVIVRDGAAVLASPDPLVRADEHIHHDPERSLLAASDMVPHRPRADVLLSGRARAPMGQAAPWVGVRLIVARGTASPGGGAVCIDKSLLVRGPPDPESPNKAPLPFHSVLLSYELAGGGDENPARALDGGEWPRVLDRWHRAFPLGFGPLGRLWPARRRVLGGARVPEEPSPDYPRDFPWAYFNVAPLDQQIDYLQGDEWIGFEGFHSQIPRVQTHLPGARGKARVYGPTPDLAAGAEVAMVADTLIVNADRMRISVVWRGRFPLPAGVDAGMLVVVGGVETSTRRLNLPVSHEAAVRLSPWRDPHDASEEAPDTQDPDSVVGDATPFGAPGSGAAGGGGEAEDIEPAPNTVDFSEDLAAVARSAAAMPFAHAIAGPSSGGGGPVTPFERLSLMGNERSVSPPPREAESADDLLPEAPYVVAPARFEVPVPARLDVPVPARLDVPVPARLDVTVPARLDVPAPARTDGVPEPPLLLGALSDPVAEPGPGEAPPPEPKKTLGAFFLAAMERRGAVVVAR